MDDDSYVIPQALQNIIKRLSAREGVEGILVCDTDGLPLKSNLDRKEAEIISAHVGSLVQKVLSTVDAIEEWGELASIFIEMGPRELIITPDLAAGFTIVVLKKRTGYR